MSLFIKNPTNKETKDWCNEIFDKNDNLIDYFLELGIKPERIKEEFFFNEDNEIFEREINKIETISIFPEYNKKSIMINPEELIPHIFPKKEERKILSKKYEKDIDTFSIIIDNQNSSEIFLRKYITCLVFYEEYSNYIQLYNMNYSQPIDNTLQKKRKIYIPKCICFISIYPLIHYHTEILKHIYEMYINKKYNKSFINSVIEQLLTKVPYPPRGKIKYNLLINDFKIELKNSKLNALPMININNIYEEVLKKYTFDDISKIIRAILLEKKIIFVSRDKEFLTKSILLFTSLIFPFKQQFSITSILPEEAYRSSSSEESTENLIEAILPYIFGITDNTIDIENAKYNDIYLIKYEDQVAKIRLSNKFNKNELIEETVMNTSFSKFKKKSVILSHEFPELPKEAQKEFKKTYEELVSKNRTTNDNIISAFYNLMANILRNYNNYLKKDYLEFKDGNHLKNMINLEAFISSFKSEDQDFYKKFTSTQMFIEYLSQRFTPRNPFEKFEILQLEEILNKSKKSFFGSFKTKISQFESLTDFDIVETKDINIVSDKYTDDEINYFINDNNKKKFLLQGININKINNNELNFDYIIFPQLRSSNYIFENHSNINKELSYYSNILSISKDILSKSYLGITKERKISDAENSVYLVYIYLWALLIYEIKSEDERKYQFIKLMKVLLNTVKLDINIMEILFTHLYNFEYYDFILILYQKLISIGFTPSSIIFDIVTNIIKKNQRLKKNKQVSYKDICEGLDNYIPYKRTFKNYDETYIISDKLVFKAYSECSSCKENINLYEASKKLFEVLDENIEDKGEKERITNNKDNTDNNNYNQWITCNKCKSCELPKLCIIQGQELFNSDYNTSITFTVDLLHPNILKEQIQKIELTQTEPKNTDVLLLCDFKKKNTNLFWNCVWYFKLLNLDISIILLKYPIIEDSSLSNKKICKNEDKVIYNEQKIVALEFSKDVDKSFKKQQTFGFDFINIDRDNNNEGNEYEVKDTETDIVCDYFETEQNEENK